MNWLVIQDEDGSWCSFALDAVEAIQYDGAYTLYVFRRGLPPKGTHPKNVSVQPDPYIGPMRSQLRAV